MSEDQEQQIRARIRVWLRREWEQEKANNYPVIFGLKHIPTEEELEFVEDSLERGLREI